MRPLLVFAHGAGAPSSSGWMRAWAERLGRAGEVHSFDYPYMAAGRARPDPRPVLERAHRAAVEAARAGRDLDIVLVGKSMGSRIGCHVASSEDPLPRIRALVCLGYPLVGQNGAVRDEVLLALRVPVLFAQGTRDKLCPLDRLARVRERMQAPSELFVVESGDHSLALTKTRLAKLASSQAAEDDKLADVIADFVRRHGSPA